MFNRIIKKIILLVFLALLVSDICVLVKRYVVDGFFNFERFDIVYSIVNNHVVLHLSLIYTLMVLILFFSFNFFKTKNKN